MQLDFTSLLLATAISGFCLSITMYVSWMSARHQSFMVTWATGLLVIVAHVVAYGLYVSSPDPLLFPAVATLLTVALSIILGAAYQFCDGRSPFRPAVWAALISTGSILAPLVWGLDGLALIIQNTAAGVLLILSGTIYLRHRAQAPTQMKALFALYLGGGLSFLLCGAVLAWDGAWIIGFAPDNWAERLNIVVSVACITGAGAISLGLHHSRRARTHEVDALTDVLTGLKNRRALFARWGDQPIGRFCSIALFDIDHFKLVNDRHGHAAGDDVLAAFGRVLGAFSREGDMAVRLGGEEFALVMPRASEADAVALAERVRAHFSALSFVSRGAAFSCTVSVGITSGRSEGISIDEALAAADRALYGAKNDGRDRVEVTMFRKTG